MRRWVVAWHHRFNGHEFEQTPGDSGQGSLACCSPWGRKELDTTVEGRNAFFLLAASVWAKTLGAGEVWTGISEADFSGYPDCREAFLKSMERSICLALDFKVRLVAPFMHKTKAEEWRIADRLGILDVVEKETLTCYRGVPGRGCGKCPACRLRRRGYEEFQAARQ